MTDPTPFEPNPTYDNSPNTGIWTGDLSEIFNETIHSINGKTTIVGVNYDNTSTISNAEFKQLLRKRRRRL